MLKAIYCKSAVVAAEQLEVRDQTFRQPFREAIQLAPGSVAIQTARGLRAVQPVAHCRGVIYVQPPLGLAEVRAFADEHRKASHRPLHIRDGSSF